jgi:hypothetical protein
VTGRKVFLGIFELWRQTACEASHTTDNTHLLWVKILVDPVIASTNREKTQLSTYDGTSAAQVPVAALQKIQCVRVWVYLL